MKINKIFVVLTIFSIISLSCNQETTKWQGSIEEVDGVTIVKNPKKGLWDSKDKHKVSMETELQIGKLDGPEEFLFESIRESSFVK